MSGGSLIALAVTLAALSEWLTERFLGKYLKGYQMVLASAILGVILCFALNIDIMALLGFEGDYYDWVGKIISGIVIGSGSNAIHKFVKPATK